MSFFWKQTDIRRLITRARNGDSWASIGLEFYPDSKPRLKMSNALKLFARYATEDDWNARRIALLQAGKRETCVPWIWVDPEVRKELVRRAMTGEPWASIGRDFYPDISAEQASRNASSAFGRLAKRYEKDARRRALKARNYNRIPGLSSRSERRRRKCGKYYEAPLVIQDPWAGMGACFA